MAAITPQATAQPTTAPIGVAHAKRIGTSPASVKSETPPRAAFPAVIRTPVAETLAPYPLAFRHICFE